MNKARPGGDKKKYLNVLTLRPWFPLFNQTPFSLSFLKIVCSSSIIGPRKNQQFVPKWYQSSGMDQRVEQLEQTVQSLSGGQEGIAKRLEELFSQLNVRMDQLSSQASPVKGNNSQTKGNDFEISTPESKNKLNISGATSSYAPKMVKLDFPRFDEKEDATSWICQAEQFFQFHRTPDEDRVEIASFHMIGDAQLWYQLLKQEKPSVTWAEFKEGIFHPQTVH